MKLRLLTAAVVAVTLTACGGSGSSSSPIASSTPSSSSSESSSSVSSSESSSSVSSSESSSSTSSSISSSSISSSISSSSVSSSSSTASSTPAGDAEGAVATLVKGAIGDNDTVPTINCTQTVDSISALEDALETVTAGDTLCLANGTYSEDFEIDFEGTGTAENPITLAAETSGGVTISGSEVGIDMGGEHLILQGFIFRDGIDGTIIKFEAEELCNNCRVTEISIIDMNTDDPYGSSKWIELEGVNNRIDHSYFSGKTSRGALLVMGRWIDEDEFDEATWPAEHVIIDHNYFGDRPPSFGKAYAGSGDNEYEAVRLGLSTTHTAISNTVVEYNYFERIQGEAEVISNKATDNIIRFNTIRDSNGSIVTRHGSGAIISNNIIKGDDNPFSGGIRLVDGDHTVTNNYVEGARYLTSNWNGGIVLTTGDGSGRTDNGYQDVENVLVANNTIVDSVNSINVSGGRESTAPSGVYFVNNIVAKAIGPVIRTNGDNMPSGSTYSGNYIYGQAFSDDSFTSYTGFNFVDAALAVGSDSLYRISSNSPDLSADTGVNVGSFSLPAIDMDGQTRTAATTSGADEAIDAAANRGLLTPALVGPINYTPEPGTVYVQKVDIANHDFDSGDFTGWNNDGGMITTTADNVFSRGASLAFDNNSSSTSQTVAISANTNYTASAFIKGTGQIAITVGGTTEEVVAVNSDYRFESVSFNSGSATSATIRASVAEFVSLEAISDVDFVGFKAGDNDWTTVEGDTTGDVAGSSNSASGSDGSAKLGYTKPAHANSSPSISQVVDLTANTEYEISLAMLTKNGSSATGTLRIEGNNSVIVDDVLLDYSAMADVDLDDSFNQFTQSLNSGNNTQATVTISFNPQAISGDATAGSDGKLSDDTQKANEFRIDNVSLTSDGAPSEGTEAFFDSFRLVSHPLTPEQSAAAD